MKTDKQLLQLNKNDLLKEYRKLEESMNNKEESMNNKEESSNLSLDEAIEVVKSNGYVVKPKTTYEF